MKILYFSYVSEIFLVLFPLFTHFLSIFIRFCFISSLQYSFWSCFWDGTTVQCGPSPPWWTSPSRLHARLALFILFFSIFHGLFTVSPHATSQLLIVFVLYILRNHIPPQHRSTVTNAPNLKTFFSTDSYIRFSLRVIILPHTITVHHHT
jgi:hypothetical protein